VSRISPAPTNTAPLISARRGRPRSPGIDEAILEATIRQLGSVGFGHMTIDSVAAEAGVGRPAVYRRWRNKVELATAALAHMNVSEPDRFTGDTRRDLVAQLARVRNFYAELRGMAMVGALLVEEERHPELLTLFREQVIRPRRAVLAKVLRDGQARGEVRADLDIDTAVALLIGPFYARYLSGERFPRTWAAQVVTMLWPAFQAGPAD
jgi:AcrR family transcriptional regulator